MPTEESPGETLEAEGRHPHDSLGVILQRMHANSQGKSRALLPSSENQRSQLRWARELWLWSVARKEAKTPTESL